VSQINTASSDYIVQVNDMEFSKKNDRFNNIHDMFEKAKDLSEDKVQLAMQTYEMVDKHIRRLDTELAKFECELKEKHMSGGTNGGALVVTEKSAKQKRGRVKTSEKRNVAGFNPKNVIKSETDKGARKKPGAKNIVENKVSALSSPSGGALAIISTPNEVLDMPVDPNEPTYCLCHQVSYGEMIGCDNSDCPIEWFHFGCVQLTSKPKGKWFCPKCSGERKKK